MGRIDFSHLRTIAAFSVGAISFYQPAVSSSTTSSSTTSPSQASLSETRFSAFSQVVRNIPILFLLLLAKVASVASSFAAGRLVADLISHNSATRQAVMLVVIILIQALLEASGRFLVQSKAMWVTRSLRDSMTVTLLHAPVASIEQFRKGDLIVRFSEDLQLVRTALVQATTSIWPGIFLAIFGLIIIGTIDLFILLIITLCLIIAIAITKWMTRNVKEASRISRNETAKLGSELDGLLSDIKTVKTKQAEGVQADRLLGLSFFEYLTSYRVSKVSAVIEPITQLITMIIVGIIIFIGTNQVNHQFLSLSSFTTVILLSFIIIGPAASALNAATVVQRVVPALKRIREVCELPAEYVPENHSVALTSPVSPIIQVQHLNFHYPQQGTIFEDFNFSADIGEIVGISGPSGVGKSTFFDLLCNFRQPSSGKILIAGYDTTHDVAKIRSYISLVSQFSFFQNSSVRTNLTLGTKELTDEQLYEVLQRVGLQHVIAALPQKLDTSLGEFGGKLSGGERQRLTIARALVDDKPILLFDEVTANLDRENEEKILELFQQIGHNKLIIISSHRESTLRISDRVVNFQQLHQPNIVP